MVFFSLLEFRLGSFQLFDLLISGSIENKVILCFLTARSLDISCCAVLILVPSLTERNLNTSPLSWLFFSLLYMAACRKGGRSWKWRNTAVVNCIISCSVVATPGPILRLKVGCPCRMRDFDLSRNVCLSGIIGHFRGCRGHAPVVRSKGWRSWKRRVLIVQCVDCPRRNITRSLYFLVLE